MASGKLGSAAPAAETLTTVYTVPSGTVTTLNVLAVNKGTGRARVRIAISPDGSPAGEDWVEYDAILAASGSVLERFGLVAGAAECVVVWASTADVAFRVNGHEGAVS
jgi:hypothetical protein